MNLLAKHISSKSYNLLSEKMKKEDKFIPDIKETKPSNLSVWQKAKESANETKIKSFSKALDDFSHLPADERKKIDSEINRIVEEKLPEIGANFFLIITAILLMLIGLLFSFCTIITVEFDKAYGGTGWLDTMFQLALITIALVSFGGAIAIIIGISKK
jgi:hypothetical protein